MPALFDSNQATKGGGARSITLFDGVFDEVEDDIKGRFGDQVQFTFIEVGNIESDQEVELEDDVFTYWMPQKTDETSSLQRQNVMWEAFIKKNKLTGGNPDALMGVRMRWKKVIFKNEGEGSDGKKMSDGKGFVPVKILGKSKDEDDEDKKPTSRTTKASAPAKRPVKPAKADEDDEDKKPFTRTKDKAKEEAPEISKALIKAALAAMGEDGNTRDSIRTAVIAKAALRSEVKELPDGIDTLLAYMVETEVASEEDGVYTAAD